MRDVRVLRVLQGEKKGLLIVGRDVIEACIRRSDMSFYAASIEYRCREARPERIHTFCQTRKSADRQCTEPAARRQDEFRKQIRSGRTEAGGCRSDLGLCKPQIRSLLKQTRRQEPGDIRKGDR